MSASFLFRWYCLGYYSSFFYLNLFCRCYYFLFICLIRVVLCYYLSRSLRLFIWWFFISRFWNIMFLFVSASLLFRRCCLWCFGYRLSLLDRSYVFLNINWFWSNKVNFLSWLLNIFAWWLFTRRLLSRWLFLNRFVRWFLSIVLLFMSASSFLWWCCLLNLGFIDNLNLFDGLLILLSNCWFLCISLRYFFSRLLRYFARWLLIVSFFVRRFISVMFIFMSASPFLWWRCLRRICSRLSLNMFGRLTLSFVYRFLLILWDLLNLLFWFLAWRFLFVWLFFICMFFVWWCFLIMLLFMSAASFLCRCGSRSLGFLFSVNLLSWGNILLFFWCWATTLDFFSWLGGLLAGLFFVWRFFIGWLLSVLFLFMSASSFLCWCSLGSLTLVQNFDLFGWINYLNDWIWLDLWNFFGRPLKIFDGWFFIKRIFVWWFLIWRLLSRMFLLMPASSFLRGCCTRCLTFVWNIDLFYRYYIFLFFDWFGFFRWDFLSWLFGCFHRRLFIWRFLTNMFLFMSALLFLSWCSFIWFSLLFFHHQQLTCLLRLISISLFLTTLFT